MHIRIGSGLHQLRGGIARRLLVGLLGSVGVLLAVPLVAQEQVGPDPLQPVLDSAMQRYVQAASRADSLRYADSALALTQAMLRRDSLQPLVLLMRAKLFKARGDSAGEYQALSTLGRNNPASTLMAAFSVGARDAWAVAKARGLLQHLPDSAQALRVIFLVARLAGDWPAVVTVGPALVKADTGAADLPYYATLLSAYDLLSQPAQVSAVVARVATRFPDAGPRAQWYSRALQQLHDSTLLRSLMQVHPTDRGLAQMAFDLAVEDKAWPWVVATGEALARLDSTAGDTTYFIQLGTAYDQLRQPAQALGAAQRGTAHYPAVWTLWRQYAVALRRATWASPAALATTVQALVRQHAGDAQFGGRLLAGFADTADWGGVAAVGEAMAQVDSAAVDTAYFDRLLTAYEQLKRPGEMLAVARWATARFPEVQDFWRRYAVAFQLAAQPSEGDLLTLVRKTLRQHAGDAQFARRLFTGFALDHSSGAAGAFLDALQRRDSGNVDITLARFRYAMTLGDGLVLQTNSGARTWNEPAWTAMAGVGHALAPECGPPSRPSRDGRGAPLGDSAAQQLCAQLLTAFIVTGQPVPTDRLVARLRARWHLSGEPELQQWYVQQLHHWFGSDSAALNVVNVLLGRTSEAVTIHQALLLHAAQTLARSVPGARVDAALPKPAVWPSEPPSGLPFERSTALTGIEFSGRFANYARADTWYTSWGADDVLYAIVADGQMDDSAGRLVGVASYVGELANTGRALITGSDPLRLTVTPLPLVYASAAPYGGRYPSATLMYRGVWYASTYTLDDLEGVCGNWCKLGPLVGFHWSTDKGRTWHAPPPEVTPVHPLFGETAKDSARVRLSAAHFVDFGKNMQYSPDGKAYLIGHGSTAPHSHSNWIAGDQVYIARVTPSPEAINDAKAWEVYAGRDAKGRPRWSKHFDDITPIVEWPDHLGNTAVTYDAPLKKYLMVTTHGWPSVGPFDTIVLEADELTGPWRLVSYLKGFGPEVYFPNVPSKFISADGCTMWLMYSANFAMAGTPANPPGSGYWMTVHKIRLLGPTLCRER